MKRLVSFIMVIVLTLGVPLFAFCEEDTNNAAADVVQNSTEVVNANGEVILTNSIIGSNGTVLIEAIGGNNTQITIKEDEMLVDGSSVAKIETIKTDSGKEESEPSSTRSIIYSDTPIYGDESDYDYYGVYAWSNKLRYSN